MSSSLSAPTCALSTVSKDSRSLFASGRRTGPGASARVNCATVIVSAPSVILAKRASASDASTAPKPTELNAFLNTAFVTAPPSPVSINCP